MKNSLWTWTVTPHQEGRADNVLLTVLAQYYLSLPSSPMTRSQLQRLIANGQVTADGKPIKASSQLKVGTQIQIRFPDPHPLEVSAEDHHPLDILFEDPHLLVINKPQNLTVHPSTTQTHGTLVNVLLHHIKDLSGIGGVLRPGIVHRIDKNTSGALVVTKTDRAHTQLAETFAKHQIERAYWAICYGSPPTPPHHSIRIESTLGRNPQDRKKMAMNVKGGRKAISFYRKIMGFSAPVKKPFASWLEITLETGRTHQIRVHLTGAGYSIFGDPTYGAPSKNHPKWLALPPPIQDQVKSLPGQALHARVLGFRHPITGESLRFEAEPPPAFTSLLEALKKDFTHA